MEENDEQIMKKNEKMKRVMMKLLQQIHMHII